MGPNLPGMRGLILVLMWNVCYLTVILILLEVTARYLEVTARYLVVTARYCSLLVVAGGYCSLLVVTTLLLLVPTFSRNEHKVSFHIFSKKLKDGLE